MLLKRIVVGMLFLGAVVSSLLAQNQNQGKRTALESSLQTRYPVTVVGGGLMGIHGNNAIRRIGGVVVLVKDGLYGAYDRNRLASNAIKNGKANVFSGSKDVELRQGERFYVNAVHVGSETVMLGLVSLQDNLGSAKTSRTWSTVSFYFDGDTLAQGDPAKIFAAIDQWLVPEGVSSTASTVPSTAVPLSTPARAIDLKPGMTRDDIVSAMGTPLQEAGFGDRRWLIYQGLTITLEQGKLTTVEHNAPALVQVKISSEPDGADVFLDGSFVSSTPAVLRLQPGTYKVAVKQSGYSDWEREVKILPGAEVNLNAKLSK